MKVLICSSNNLSGNMTKATTSEKSKNGFSQNQLMQLLTINKAIVESKTVVELLATIREKVMALIPFYDTGILIVESNGLHHYDISINIKGWDDSRTNMVLQQQENLLSIYHPGSYLENIIQRLEENPQPLIEDWEQVFANWEHPFFPFSKDAGYKEGLVGLLRTGDKVLGGFWLNSLTKKHFTKKQFPLFQAITEQVSVAVTNILAKEEILEREQEKKILLSISEAVATIREKKALLKLVFEKVRPLFNFHDAGFFVFSDEKKLIEDWTVAMPEISPSETNYKLANTIASAFEFQGSGLQPFYQQLKEIKKPLIITYDETLFAKYPDYPQWDAIKEAGYKESLGALLRADDGDVGILFFNSLTAGYFKSEHFTLFQGIADQLAAAVANIIANEEITEREKEKTQLLKISEAIASIKDYKELLTVIYDVIKPAFPFENTGIFIEEKNGEQVFEITDTEILHRTVTRQITAAKISGPFLLKDFKEGSWYYTNVPIITNVSKEIKLINDPICKQQFKISIEAGLQQMICGPLVSGGRKIGAIYLSTKQKDLYEHKSVALFKSVTDLIAIGVANILANQEIKNKAQEIKELNKQLEAQNTYLSEEVEQQYNFDEMIGQNQYFIEVCRSIGLVAKTDTSVLILGETGTGKELVARAIHNNSSRKNKPLIKLNCAALPANLIESELFGHERGAFTGAIDRRIGKFELANGSTLFLDEVGELPIELQAKLLRALQEKEIERLGSNKTLQIDVRIIAATNRDLEKEVQSGKFRQDLFYRLHIFPITLPPLRERKEDIALLAAHFVQKYGKKIGKNIQGFGNKAMQEMMAYNWPGNIRELEHVIERSVILNNTKLIQELNLPDASKKRISSSPAAFVIKTWQEQERDYILEVLKVTNGNMAGKGGAAELLQLPPTTLQSKMNKLGIKRKHFAEKKTSNSI